MKEIESAKTKNVPKLSKNMCSDSIYLKYVRTRPLLFPGTLKLVPFPVEVAVVVDVEVVVVVYVD